MVDEKPYAIYFWIWLIVNINVQWILIDVWLHRHHHEYLTTEIREALKTGPWAALVMFLICGTIGAFCWHMLVQK